MTVEQKLPGGACHPPGRALATAAAAASYPSPLLLIGTSVPNTGDHPGRLAAAFLLHFLPSDDPSFCLYLQVIPAP